MSDNLTYIHFLSQELNIAVKQVKATIGLLEEGSKY
jgi:hypothetical protein